MGLLSTSNTELLGSQERKNRFRDKLQACAKTSCDLFDGSYTGI